MSAFGLIIAFVVYAVIKVVSSVNADKAPAVPQPQGEAFPPIEFEEEAEVSDGPVGLAQKVEVPAVQRVPKRSGAAAEEPVRDNKAAAPVQKEGRLRIRTASEAKRAFVYSEIFNRKY
ncbi:MAG: hypothetical protein IKZ37_06040 [Bacteroidaceae bacterium]|nr:hypothetical protein [Bacteroidaceae bacterium]